MLEADLLFMAEAIKEAKKATCPRFAVGMVLVWQGKIIARACNGAPLGLPSCNDSSCLVINNHCRRTVHAEPKAIAGCAVSGISPAGATAYMTWFPCLSCMQLLILGGIKRLVYVSASDPNGNYGKEFEVARELALSKEIELYELSSPR